MRRPIFLLLTVALGAPALAEGAPPAALQSELKYAPVPLFQGVFAAPVTGTATQPGALYALSVKYAAGARSLPHTHPDTRVVTIISGRFYAGVGGALDEASLRILGPGDSIVIPAETVHHGWAKDGEVLMLETGVGPTGASLWPKPPPQR
ncbi:MULTISPECIES: cupin domain-containing protein [Methylosinus]|uniref:Cupin domain-containing protein n=1 Tax=Methylosinus trichosporium (strain ATCC 35070 / NCIMB 11131 / UNIQEM 75 / OB3b) TaxID=595536 RepID=A0A2D2D2Z7_METT3|nr:MULTISPECIES: cupin domain-containing protein [Methylosinus]ATQ69344.1 cupin domain-containing protein [Methylosinus trichosporium OB3b]OBS52861.1 radical SAM protein [Methylosinus sp. 3S-1]